MLKEKYLQNIENQRSRGGGGVGYSCDIMNFMIEDDCVSHFERWGLDYLSIGQQLGDLPAWQIMPNIVRKRSGRNQS